MNRDEIDRLKEEEKAHLRKVRALKQQLRDAKRLGGINAALRSLDPSGLDATHEEMLRQVTEQNVTAEARYELAMEALDAAAKQEADREELARLDAERQKADAADLVQQMKTQMLGDAHEHAEAQHGETRDGEAPPEVRPSRTKTIGPADRSEAAEAAPESPAPESDASPSRSIGRFGGSRD